MLFGNRYNYLWFWEFNVNFSEPSDTRCLSNYIALYVIFLSVVLLVCDLNKAKYHCKQMTINVNILIDFTQNSSVVIPTLLTVLNEITIQNNYLLELSRQTLFL